MRLCRYGEASKALEACIEINPEYSDTYFKLAYCKTKTGQFREALELFDTNLKVLTKKTENFFKKGYALTKNGKVQEALIELSKTNEINQTGKDKYHMISLIRVI